MCGGLALSYLSLPVYLIGKRGVLMCGIAGILNMSLTEQPELKHSLGAMNSLQKHRGPDGSASWQHPYNFIGLAHQRLSIIDLITGNQPMNVQSNWITYNGEIYNYVELRRELGLENFKTSSDTEVILRAYQKWGPHCVNHLRGMFAFALWDEINQVLFCARDRFGIKPLYYTKVKNVFYFASEIKTLLPFIDRIETDLEGFQDYLTFQFCLGSKTLFKNIHTLLPGHTLQISKGGIKIQRYWEVYYEPDFKHTSDYFKEKLQSLLTESVHLHLRSDVLVGAQVSGGLDSGAVVSLASMASENSIKGFNGKFSAFGSEYDESYYAKLLADKKDFELLEIDITATDFIENISKVIYHLDHPVAGPGAFSQYMVSQLTARHCKVVLGGLGGDEVFGGYTRYLIAYFEQCIKGAIEGTMGSGNFVVTYESIIPNLTALRNYKPLLQKFWREGLFESMERRYFRLVNRASLLDEEINWNLLGKYSSFESFRRIFNSSNVCQTSYFDLMTHFDFKTLLPALLHVEDRMSMAHGLESRVPLLDHPLVEFAATIPSDIKFKDGEMKYIFKQAIKPFLPQALNTRQDKMGFPTPVIEWFNGEVRDFVLDTFSSQQALHRELVNNQYVTKTVFNNKDKNSKFDRTIWGLLCLELWQQKFHDEEHMFKKRILQ